MTHYPIDAPQFFLTAPARCPYLPDRLERKVFTHLVGERAGPMNDALSQGGFRRSQNIAYRPACENCRACVSVRIPVDRFQPSRTQRRTLQRNADIVARERPPITTDEQFDVFHAYLANRHADGGMIDMNQDDYATMVEDTHVRTLLVEYRLAAPDGEAAAGAEKRHNGLFSYRGDLFDLDDARSSRPPERLVATALTDVLADGLSMVYSFYDTDSMDRSLGTQMILDHVERTRRRGLPYLYLGYWVRGSKKMDYKRRFRPLEYLSPQGWTLLDDADGLD